jgi:hypothetical protein
VARQLLRPLSIGQLPIGGIRLLPALTARQGLRKRFSLNSARVRPGLMKAICYR